MVRHSRRTVVIAQNCVRLGNWEADDCDRQFVIRRYRLGHGQVLVIKVGAMGSIAFGGHGCGAEQPSTPEPSQLYSDHERLGRTSFVAMMEAADLWERDNLAGTEWVYWSALRTILGEREMRSRLVVIVKVRRQHAAQMMLIEDDDVIQTFTADRTNDAFDVGVLPRRARRSNNLLDTHHTRCDREKLAI